MISVIISAYNPGEYLQPCLDSILAQNGVEFEIILVDDGSNPAIPDPNHEKITLIRQPNSGVSAARNLGLSRASGEYCLFFDADDLMEPNALKSLHDLAKSDPNLDGAYGNGRILWMFDNPERNNTELIFGEDKSLFELLTHRPIAVCSALIKTEHAKIIQGFRNHLSGTSEDWDFYLRLCKGKRFAYLHQPIFTYRQHESSQSRDYAKLHKNTQTMLREHKKSGLISPEQYKRAMHHQYNWTAREMRNQLRRASNKMPELQRIFALCWGRPVLEFWFWVRLLRP